MDTGSAASAVGHRCSPVQGPDGTAGRLDAREGCPTDLGPTSWTNSGTANAERLVICNYTAGKDHRTYELALAILNEEVEHESWFNEFLGEGPSGHFRRGAPGVSPYVSRFMCADVGRA
jgi:hypothetical protein